MFKIPMHVVQVDERQRGDQRVIALTLTENNEDPRIHVSEITINLKVRFDNDDDPENGFERKRFNLGDTWVLSLDEKP